MPPGGRNPSSKRTGSKAQAAARPGERLARVGCPGPEAAPRLCPVPERPAHEGKITSNPEANPAPEQTLKGNVPAGARSRLNRRRPLRRPWPSAGAARQPTAGRPDGASKARLRVSGLRAPLNAIGNPASPARLSRPWSVPGSPPRCRPAAPWPPHSLCGERWVLCARRARGSLGPARRPRLPQTEKRGPPARVSTVYTLFQTTGF